MNYSINPNTFCSMFAIPSEVVDKHLKLAGSVQLKTLLIFLRNSGKDPINTVADQLKISAMDVRDALDFWADAGILIKDGDVSSKKAQPQTKKPLDKLPLAASKPSREDAIKRGAESKEIQFMFNEVQLKLGRLVSQAEMSTLVWLHDNQGLPVPVILMSIEYAKNEGKTNFSYIEKVCIDWAKNGIDTLEKAEERINCLFLTKTAWRIVESAFDISHRKASANEEKYSQRWVNEWGFTKDMLTLAYNQCIDSISKLSFPYINKILDNWQKKSIKKPDDIKNETAEKATPTKTRTTSYNIEDIKKKFNNFEDD